MTSDESGSAKIIVIATHSPFAYIYAFFRPTIAINDENHRRPWGKHTFEVPAGSYDVTVSYPWIFSPECGKNSVRLI